MDDHSYQNKDGGVVETDMLGLRRRLPRFLKWEPSRKNELRRYSRRQCQVAAWQGAQMSELECWDCYSGNSQQSPKVSLWNDNDRTLVSSPRGRFVHEADRKNSRRQAVHAEFLASRLLAAV